VRLAAWVLLAAAAPAAAGGATDAMPEPLTALRGDPVRGRAIVADRRTGLCLLCHRAPIAEVRFQGSVGPDLRGVGARLTEGEIRLRIVDPRRIDAQSIMPAYGRSEGLERVAAAYRGKPLLEPQQIEDVVAYLATLR